MAKPDKKAEAIAAIIVTKVIWQYLNSFAEYGGHALFIGHHGCSMNRTDLVVGPARAGADPKDPQAAPPCLSS